LIATHNGPLDEYLRATGKPRESFEAELKRGDPAAASIFAAEVLFGAVQDLIMTIEGGQAKKKVAPKKTPKR
jgi:hypothetical protein